MSEEQMQNLRKEEEFGGFDPEEFASETFQALQLPSSLPSLEKIVGTSQELRITEDTEQNEIHHFSYIPKHKEEPQQQQEEEEEQPQQEEVPEEQEIEETPSSQALQLEESEEEEIKQSLLDVLQQMKKRRPSGIEPVTSASAVKEVEEGEAAVSSDIENVEAIDISEIQEKHRPSETFDIEDEATPEPPMFPDEESVEPETEVQQGEQKNIFASGPAENVLPEQQEKERRKRPIVLFAAIAVGILIIGGVLTTYLILQRHGAEEVKSSESPKVEAAESPLPNGNQKSPELLTGDTIGTTSSELHGSKSEDTIAMAEAIAPEQAVADEGAEVPASGLITEEQMQRKDNGALGRNEQSVVGEASVGKTQERKTLQAENIQQQQKQPVKKTSTSMREEARRAQTQSTGVYLVQVYATPSVEDAKRWKAHLESLGIPSVIIQTYEIGDQLWYRVRFGPFQSKTEAEQAVRKYGLSQVWIVRVR